MAIKKQIPVKNEQRARLSQSDIPAYTLEKALSIARSIGDNYAYKPATPLDVASALGVVPTTGPFRMLTGASLAYGLTSAGWNAGTIGITALGLRIVRPLADDADDLKAKREAVLPPKIVGEFLRKYDNAALPKSEIAKNVLLTLGVPADRTDDAYSMIIENAKSVGFLRQINEKTFVDLKGAEPPRDGARQVYEQTDLLENNVQAELAQPEVQLSSTSQNTESAPVEKTRRIFITHGKNMTLVEQVQTMLSLGGFACDVAEEEETAAIPVPEKVFNAMRRCQAGIIIVSADEASEADDGEFRINENVLIEIGAAFVLYDRKVVLVWDKRLPVPSNLQGLYRCDFQGDEFSWSTGMKLMKALKEFK